VVAATSPITYDSGTQTVAFDQAANNTTNDGRYARLAAANAFTQGQTVVNGTTTQKPFTVNAISGTSVNAFEVQIVGNPSLYLTSGGTLYNSGRLIVRNDYSATANIGVATSTQKGLVVRGAASQSANLQEWQNSAGSVIASVSPSGGITAGADFNTTSGFYRLASNAILGTESGGTALRMIKATSTPGNLSTNVARIYVRDGSTAGTLKLVVKAAAGAETTILDNIPQT
jgi:hypothetical protein